MGTRGDLLFGELNYRIVYRVKRVFFDRFGFFLSEGFEVGVGVFIGGEGRLGIILVVLVFFLRNLSNFVI